MRETHTSLQTHTPTRPRHATSARYTHTLTCPHTLLPVLTHSYLSSHTLICPHTQHPHTRAYLGGRGGTAPAGFAPARGCRFLVGRPRYRPGCPQGRSAPQGRARGPPPAGRSSPEGSYGTLQHLGRGGCQSFSPVMRISGNTEPLKPRASVRNMDQWEHSGMMKPSAPGTWTRRAPFADA